MVTISHFNGLTQTDAEAIEHDIEDWLNSLAVEPHDHFAGKMMHPGWSPATYDPPKRQATNVRSVYALVLDHDHGASFDHLVALWSGSSGVVYTTKSHTEERPRYRSVLALNRPVTAEEHAKIWQWGAERCAAASCPVDQTCKDASRFWYDPTVPEAAPWRAQRLTGAPIDADAIIALAPKPPPLRVVRPRVNAPADDRVKRARAYLAKLPSAVSGSAGHTATFNAVACVMIGFDLDAATTYDLIASEYNPRCDPPWSERELKHKLSSVEQRCDRERGYLLVDRPRVSDTKMAASYAPPPADDLDADWQSLLLTKADRTARRAYHNTAVFVRHHPEFRGKWSYDEMTGQPWFSGAAATPNLANYIRAQADCRLGYTPSIGDVEAAISGAARDRPFHPVRQYLRSCDWDGQPRLAAMARDYFRLEQPIYSEMLRKFMIGAAARALWPGCKLDTALMLVGPQGYRKSTFFSVLGGPWHADTFIDITNKDGALQLHAAWIYELAELENVVSGTRESRLKAWITSTHDLYRAPYARGVERKPRGMVLGGSTNREQILTDDSGSRRFWILPVRHEVPWELLADLRDQLWGEAFCAAESGEPWWLERPSEMDREIINREYQEQDSWTDPVSAWLSNPRIESVTVSDVLLEALRVELPHHGRWEQMRVSKILKSLGWKRKHVHRVWTYVRGGQLV